MTDRHGRTPYGSAETWGSDQTRWGFGLRINSTGYELARMFFNSSGSGARRGFSGVVEITRLPAKTYPVRPRVIRLAGGSGNFGLSFYSDDDFVSYSIEETP